MVKLQRVKTRAEIRQSLLNFNLGAATNKHLVFKLIFRWSDSSKAALRNHRSHVCSGSLFTPSGGPRLL